jgi:hypothetical protein
LFDHMFQRILPASTEVQGSLRRILSEVTIT